MVDVALREAYDAWRALAPVDMNFARKVGRLLAHVEKVRAQDDLGKAPSLKGFGLCRRDDTMLAADNPLLGLRTAAFDAMEALRAAWPKPSRAQQKQESKQRRRSDPVYREIQEDLRTSSHLRKRAREGIGSLLPVALFGPG